MYTLYSNEKAAEICVLTDLLPVLLAANDLKRDLNTICKTTDKFSIGKNTDSGIIIRITGGKPETCFVTVNENGVTINGADALGTVYGIYAFEEKLLNIPKDIRFSGLYPEADGVLSVNDTEFSIEDQKVRFRGIFLNDEDLLTDFLGGEGKRHFDYRFYRNVMHSKTLDMVLETALRTYCNLIIPSSFVDIDNPDEERLIKQTVDRGMYITQHHVEPMGVSYFAAESYMKKHGIKGEVSFVTNRGFYEEIWRYYAKRWAKYKDNVIWQLGLRGKADRAVWLTDKSVSNDNASRGRLISDAVNLQYEIVKETLGTENFYSSTTVWLESAELYGKGYLKLPEKSYVIFSDIGMTMMPGDDFYKVPRQKGKKYGMYYHAAFYGAGPHLAEGCDPRKLCDNIKIAKEKESLDYCILNVANLKETCFSAMLYSELLQDPDGFSLESYLKSFCKTRYKSHCKEAEKAYKTYYDSFFDLGDDEYKASCERSLFYYHEYKNSPYPVFVAADGTLRFSIISKAVQDVMPEAVMKKTEMTLKSAESFKNAGDLFEEIMKSSKAPLKDYIKTNPLLMARYMQKMNTAAYRSLQYLTAEDGTSKLKFLDAIIKELRDILLLQKSANINGFEGWYDNDKKIGIAELIEKLENKKTKI